MDNGLVKVVMLSLLMYLFSYLEVFTVDVAIVTLWGYELGDRIAKGIRK